MLFCELIIGIQFQRAAKGADCFLETLEFWWSRHQRIGINRLQQTINRQGLCMIGIKLEGSLDISGSEFELAIGRLNRTQSEECFGFVRAEFNSPLCLPQGLGGVTLCQR